jgi:hypothetical protein
VPALSRISHISLIAFDSTIHKIHTFVEAQQDGNRISNLLRYSEMSNLLKDCRAGMQNALEAFKAGYR